MTISRDNYKYTIKEGDSLLTIAVEHGFEPADLWARKIWEHSNNEWMYRSADMHGRPVNRQLHMGNNQYVKYDHTKYDLAKEGKEEYRGYDNPHQIILYSGEKIWIPPRDENNPPEVNEENTQLEEQHKPIPAPGIIPHVLSDEELIHGFVGETGKTYQLTFPVFTVRIDREDVLEDDTFTLTGKTSDDEIIYEKTLTVKDDKIEGDEYIDLNFNLTPKNLLYTLEVDPGKEEKQEDGKQMENAQSENDQNDNKRYAIMKEQSYPK